MRNRREAEPQGELPFSINCYWRIQPFTFGGLNFEKLTALCQQLGHELGIKPDEARKIRIHFGDHYGLTSSDGEQGYSTAWCGPTSDRSGNIKNCHLVFNRSMELFRLEQAVLYLPASKRSNTSPAPTDEIEAWVETPFEYLAWMLAEELHHAQVMLRATTIDKFLTMQLKYQQYLQRMGQSLKTYSYNLDIVEIAACRNVLRLLSRILPDQNRAAYFAALYQRSLEEKKAVVPIPNLPIVRAMFLPTGFSPENRDSALQFCRVCG